MKKFLVCTLLLAVAPGATACSTSLDTPFFTPGPLPKNVLIDYAHLPSIPPIKAKVLSVRRADAKLACDFYAEIEIALEWQTDSPYSIGDFGIYVRPPPYAYPRTSFWGIPLAPRMRDGVAYITAYIQDPGTLPHAPIDMDIEIFAVNDALQIGPSTKFRLHADGG
jgi:hypothetical protein